MTLVFNVQQANGKPDDNRRPGTACPFCDTEGLTDIIRRDGDCIWLENKFKTLRATCQTVLIESADHDADLVTYEPDELHHVMRFALGCWQQMIDSQQYRSVLMYKNKGPLSGGSSFIRTYRLWVWSRKTAMLRCFRQFRRYQCLATGEDLGQHLNRTHHGVL